MADGKVVIDVILDDGTVAKGVANIGKRLDGATGKAKKFASGVGQITAALGITALASKGIDMIAQSLDGAISRYDTLTSFPRVLQLMGFDAKDSQKAIDKLSDGIDGLPTTLDSVASKTQRIAGMTGDLDGAVDTTLALNNAFLASGASTADAERGLDQYVQMLSKGQVDLESWRTLQETMPIALNKTAEAFGFAGRSAQNDLYDALKSGEITFDEFNGKLVELNNATGGFADMARESSGGIATSWQNMKTAVVKGVADVIGAVDEALGGVGSISGIIDSVKSGMQVVFSWIVANIPVIAEWIRSVVDVIKSWLPPMDEIKNGFITAFQTIYAFVTPIVQEIVNFIMTVWGGLVAWWQENGQMIVQAIQNAMTVIMAIMQAVWPVIQFLVIDTWNAIKGAIQGAIGVITGIIQAFSALFTGNWSALWDAIKQIVSSAVKLVWNLVQLWFVGKILKAGKSLFTGLKSIVTSLWNAVKSLFTSGVNTARNVVNAGFNAIRSVISKVMNAVRSIISSIWNAIKSIISSVLNGIRGTVSSVWNGIRSTITSVVNSIRSTIRSVFNSLRGIVSGAFNNVKSAVRTGITGALNIIKGMFSTFKNAGRNIVTSIADGIKGAIGTVTDAIGSVTSKIRDFLPFSPAKEGALRDIMDVQIAESIAKAIDKGKSSAINAMRGLTDDLNTEIQPNVSVNRLRGITAPLGRVLPNTIATGGNSVSNTNSKSYNPTINNYFTREESTPSEVSRKNKQQQQRLAMEWGY